MIRTTTRIRRQLGIGFSAASLVLLATGCATTTETAPASPSASVEQSEAPATSTPEATKPAETTEAASTLTLLATSNGQGNYIVTANGVADAGTETLNEKLITADRGCFHATARDAAPTLLIFPDGTTLTSNGKPSIEVGGASYAVGSQLTFTGTTVTLSAENLAEAAPCEPHGAVFLVSSITN